ncbi:MAG TPA: hypothetical protein VF049_08950 [Nocardioidaceae bacterium]|jgi:hypothetical protein
MTVTPREAAGDDVLAGTTDVLVRTLRALGHAGHPDAASRLAARAWWVLRDSRPREAERVNGAMHYLARLPQEPVGEPVAQPIPEEER